MDVHLNNGADPCALPRVGFAPHAAEQCSTSHIMKLLLVLQRARLRHEHPLERWH